VVEKGTAADRARALLDGIEPAPTEAVRATRDLIAALTATRATFPEWEDRRRALLVSPERAGALAGARGASLSAGDQPEAAGAST
jgi:hypothetical protein